MSSVYSSSVYSFLIISLAFPTHLETRVTSDSVYDTIFRRNQEMASNTVADTCLELVLFFF